jgi:hypothetical protein
MSYLRYNLCHTNATINRIGGVLASVLASSAVNRGFEPVKLSKYVSKTLHIKNVMYSRYVPTFPAWQWKKRL